MKIRHLLTSVTNNSFKGLLFFSLLIFSSISCYGQITSDIQDSSYDISKLNALLNENINNKKVVMIADNFHGHQTYKT